MGHRLITALILKLGDADSCCPRHHRDSHRKNVRPSNGIWDACSDTEHARMSQCLRRLVLVAIPDLTSFSSFRPSCRPSPANLHSAIPSAFSSREEQARPAYWRLCWLLMMTMIGSATAAPGVSIAMSAAEPISHRRNNVDFSRLLMASLQHYGWWLSLLLYAPGLQDRRGI